MGGRIPCPSRQRIFSLPRLSPAGDRIAVQIGASRELWIYDLRPAHLDQVDLGPHHRLFRSGLDPRRKPRGLHHLVRWRGRARLGTRRWKRPGRGAHQGRWHALVRTDPPGDAARRQRRDHDRPGSRRRRSRISCSCRWLGRERLETLFQAPGVERNPAIAPSGRFIAYNSDESGRPEVYVRPFPNVGSRKWQISTEGGAGPVWTRGGSEIVYIDGQGRMVAVAVLNDRDGKFDYSKPKELFKVGTRRGAVAWIVAGMSLRTANASFLTCPTESRKKR